MARLQDMQTVSPTSSDKMLVVQSQGQGLASWGSKLDSANPTGTGSLSLNRASGSTVGSYSTTEGLNCVASSSYSHAEGQTTTASGYHAHAEGQNTTASGNRAHAEGQGTTAEGNYTHAEGRETTASGNESHAEGYGTIANHASQHVFGEYNTADASTAAATARGNYVEVVGNGTGTNARSNARTLDWSGNEVLAGGLKLHGNQDAATISVISSFASGDTLNCASYSDGAIVFLYRPAEGMVGIYAKANGWTRMVPIISISTVSINGYVLTNNSSSTLVGTVISS